MAEDDKQHRGRRLLVQGRSCHSTAASGCSPEIHFTDFNLEVLAPKTLHCYQTSAMMRTSVTSIP